VRSKGTKREKIAEIFTNTTAVMFKYDYEAAKLGKVAQELSKKFDKLKIRGGFVEDDVTRSESARRRDGIVADAGRGEGAAARA
jgi:ribosomal protein L10